MERPETLNDYIKPFYRQGIMGVEFVIVTGVIIGYVFCVFF